MLSIIVEMRVIYGENAMGAFLCGGQLSKARYVRWDVGITQTAHHREQGDVGRQRQGDKAISKRRILDFENRRAVERLAAGIWQMEYRAAQQPDFEWLMIDASHIKAHPHGAGAVGGNQDMEGATGGSTPRYIWPWMRMVCRSDSLSQRVPSLIVRRLAP